MLRFTWGIFVAHGPTVGRALLGVVTAPLRSPLPSVVSKTALARSHRPRRFAEVSSQEHVSETLRRAVANGRVGHAYLFCGPRGIGKTTLARVLAMSLNCSRRESDGEPCGSCENCERIWKGTTSLDVVEIDAASNRGVDDARDLRERAMYAPSEEGRSKVYIVDEAHMLTREAWNALLKILEEPPPGVIFIFATTEPQKIEQTAAPILSRCQRFDFRRLGVVEIADRLREVLELEGAEASEAALRLIARKADGGMRDALSLTDQILSLSDGEITPEAVRRLLGLVEEEKFLELFDLLLERDRAGLFRIVEELLDHGYDLFEFYRGMVEGLRVLLRLRVGGDGADLPEERLADWAARAERFGPAELVRMLRMAVELETGGSLRRSAQPRVILELLLLRFSYLDRTVELEALLQALGGESPSSGEPTEGPGSPSAAPRSPSATLPPPSAAPGSLSETPGTPSSAPETSKAAKPTDRTEQGVPERDAAGGVESGDEDLVAAWGRLLAGPEGVPKGLTPLLRGVDVRMEEAGVLTVPLLPGPGLERLRDPAVLAELEGALSRHASREVSIRVEEASTPEQEGGARISQDEARSGRMRDLLEAEPGLRSAVESLDLELLDE